MCWKFYISNDIYFIRGVGILADNLSGATHYKNIDAQNYIANHPDHKAVFMKKSKRGKDYVISTNQLFLGEGNKVVNSMNKAKAFKSPTDAYAYLDKTPEAESLLGTPRVIRNDYTKIKREAIIPQVEKLTPDNTGRISFTNNTKQIIMKKSNGICAICGKPIYQEDLTIDHINPLSRGGTNDIDNLRATHKFCNQLKDNLTDDEMYKTVGDIACYNLFNDPSSDIGARIVRSMVRGIINKNVLV